MRVNRFVANALGIGRRKADDLIAAGRVRVDDKVALLGGKVNNDQLVRLDDQELHIPEQTLTIMVNKPSGVVVSKNGQGSSTIYDMLPPKYSGLKPVGRLDKDSTGLLLLTNDGLLANRLTHPSANKLKEYMVTINKPLKPGELNMLNEDGVKLEDGISKFDVKPSDLSGTKFIVKMHEGRNRQIRRTFDAIGYKVTGLHRYKFGSYLLGNLKPGEYRSV